jgi:hypothetical protein
VISLKNDLLGCSAIFRLQDYDGDVDSTTGLAGDRISYRWPCGKMQLLLALQRGNLIDDVKSGR